MEKYANKRMMFRRGGRFYKPTSKDFGIGGVCPKCNHLLLQHYDGDPRDGSPDPRKFRYRCFTCEPLTDDEKKLQAEIEASKPKPVSIIELLSRPIGS